MTLEEIEKFQQKRREYSALRDKIDQQANFHFEKIRKTNDRSVNLGVKKMPMGYVCVVRDPEDDNMDGYRSREFYWIDNEGTRSEMFEDQWAVYYSARNRHLNDFQFTKYSEEELQLIRTFDEILNQNVRFGRLKVYH